MKFLTRTPYPTLLLGTMFWLHGCSGSPLSDLKKKEETDSTVLMTAELPKPATKKYSSATTTAPAETLISQETKTTARKTRMPAMAEMTATGMVINHDSVENRFRPPVYSEFQRESYNAINENPFIATTNDPLSTFSIDVDTASYANIRRFITGGSLPPVGAVRIEEMINYFSYNYPESQSEPISISAELGPCPWQPENKLVRIGLKARDLDPEKLPPSNLVFLIDVSGSMNQPNKLPLLKQSMLMLLDQLSARDRVAIVVYAGSDCVVLPPTAGNKKEEIRKAITTLSPGGSTHASSGITTAYQLARQGLMPNGNNRIILASDGDFNVGVTSRGELERLVAKERESGVFLTVLGFGMGNYHDDTMEILADKGNGNYGYIDSLLEAKKVLIKERASTFFTIAKDVKLQIEFNPTRVGGYRLVGYENRALADEDFNDDKKDAGEIGSGHTVTALYELLPPGSEIIPRVDRLKYQSIPPAAPSGISDEVLNIKVRYKPVNSNKSILLTRAVTDSTRSLHSTSDDFRFSAAVAGFGALLRHSDHAETLNYPQLIAMARDSRGEDTEGYRAEFIRLLEMGELISRQL
jgi:Ca-activated chloride channel family protein